MVTDDCDHAPPLRAHSTAHAKSFFLMVSPKLWVRQRPRGTKEARAGRLASSGRHPFRGYCCACVVVTPRAGPRWWSRQRGELHLAQRHDLVLPDHLEFGVRAQPLVPDLADLAGLVHGEQGG